MASIRNGVSFSDDVVRMARKRGIGGLVCGVALVVLGIVVFATALMVELPALASVAVAFAAIGVLTVLVAVVALSIARQNPATPAMNAVNEISTVLIVVVALVGAAAIALVDRTFIFYPLILSLVVLGFYMSLIGRANRKVLRRDVLGIEPGA